MADAWSAHLARPGGATGYAPRRSATGDSAIGRKRLTCRLLVVRAVQCLLIPVLPYLCAEVVNPPVEQSGHPDARKRVDRAVIVMY